MRGVGSAGPDVSVNRTHFAPGSAPLLRRSKAGRRIFGDAIEVALNLFVEVLRSDAVQRSSVDVEQHPSSTLDANWLADVPLGNGCGFWIEHICSVAGRDCMSLSRKATHSNTNAENVHSAGVGGRLRELPNDREGSTPTCECVK